MKLGSLFDGSGGFGLAGSLCGIEPVWASEVEPYPIAVTRSRFPHMTHLGSVTEINGAEIEPVDVITFGSPCQDMSVAGKRAGLKHENNGDDETTRSGLFMEAVRIIKEMRCTTNGNYPTYALWENVPGAFSSNGGEDFRTVLEELARVSEPEVSIPRSAKWQNAGEILGDGWSIAWRVFDAQHWGVPQRRRRIYLVADFAGGRAGKVLFEREGLRGHSAESGAAREGTAGDAENCSGTADCKGVGFDGYNGDLTGDAPIAIDRAFFNQGQNALYDSQLYEDGSNPTLVTRGPNAVCIRYIVRRLTLTECARLQGFPDTWGHPDHKEDLTDEEYDFWLDVRNTHAAINGKATKKHTKEQMLTWYNKLHTDSAEYKMWGNGICLYNALYVLEGIAEELKNS